MTDAEKLAKELGGDGRGERLRRLASTAEGKGLERVIDGAALAKAFRSGDAAALRNLFDTLLSTAEGKKLADDVGRIMGK